MSVELTKNEKRLLGFPELKLRHTIVFVIAFAALFLLVAKLAGLEIGAWYLVVYMPTCGFLGGVIVSLTDHLRTARGLIAKLQSRIQELENKNG